MPKKEIEKKPKTKKVTKKTPVKDTSKKTKTTTAKKEPISKTVSLKKEDSKYFETIGRRKTSRARVRLFTQGKKEILVNNKPFDVYFPVISLQKTVESPFKEISSLGKYGVSIKVSGGGLSGQAGACRQGISRALVLLNSYFRKKLKKAGFLTRDPRMRERKKFGLKRARRAPQWSKR